MLVVDAAIEAPVSRRPQVLLIGNGGSDEWKRVVAGARAAADILNIELHVEATVGGHANSRVAALEQAAAIQNLNLPAFDGVAFFPADAESQIELVNYIAGQTKLVTLGRDCDNSKRLCYVGVCDGNDGRAAARMVRERMTRPGKVALVSPSDLDARGEREVSERLHGFREQWNELGDLANYKICEFAIASTDRTLDASLGEPPLLEVLGDAELAYIVAFDVQSAEHAMELFAGTADGRVPIIAFGASDSIFTGIEDGRVEAAVCHDPHRDGFEAMQRLDVYIHVCDDQLPEPGHGSYPVSSEVVLKENVADARGRMLKGTAVANADGKFLAARHARPR
jgi:ABC-type sugar transport system substrate-binding protein